MSTSSRVTILLADEDALRREGLAAVLSGIENLEIVAGVDNGEDALAQVRSLRPTIAIVDLNLPQLPGIELVRRIQAEALGTKVLILAGASDDAAIGEVLRAGCDGCLLKNSPPRHLIDAISYVRDGGRYFSPQLSRHTSDQNGRDQTENEAQPALDDHDYQVMSIMTDGIRPILDRLDGIDARVAQMEIVEVRPSPRPAPGGENPEAIEAKLPGMIEDAVTRRFHQMTGRLQTRIEETQVRTLETFVQNIQVKLVQRVSALEHDIANHAGAMNDLREYSQRTEDNLSRLIAGVDRLAQEPPKRLAAVEADLDEDAPPARRGGAESPSSRRRFTHVIQIAIAAVIVTGIVAWGVGR
ncbi:MAG: response regulator transcription factor, partial [Terriglobia bacterium]